VESVEGQIELFVLGGIELRGVAPSAANALLAQPKVTALLVFLAMAPEQRPQRRDRVVGLLWPDLDQAHARTALRKATHALRKGLGADTILSRGDEDLAVRPEFSCDAADLTKAFSKGQLQHAVELYKGEMMPGFYLPDCGEFERWLEGERQSARECAAASALALAAIREQESALTVAGRLARQAVAFKWDDERVLRKAMQVLARIGDNAGALRIYDDFSARMRSELSADPAPETRRLADSLRGKT
jgi:DNA-binding SARP family transcriptional activator